MNDNWHEFTPTTPELLEMTRRVEYALAHEVNLLGREGVPTSCILAGLGMTVADLITTQANAAEVAPWFEKQAALLRRLLPEPGKSN